MMPSAETRSHLAVLTFTSPASLVPQVYQRNTGHYLCRNKYYGRGLSIDGFRQALYQYLHNGKALRRDLFEPVLSKLRSLKAVLERQASYRFYSSSLLIIYEGQVREELHFSCTLRGIYSLGLSV